MRSGLRRLAVPAALTAAATTALGAGRLVASQSGHVAAASAEADASPAIDADSAAASPSGERRPPPAWVAHRHPSILIKYFDARGVMEVSRLALALGGVAFAETRWPLDVSKMEDGLAVAAPEYCAAVDSGELDANLGRGPVVVVGGETVLAQSKAIERFFARMLGLMGEDELSAAAVDAFTEHVRDLKEKYQRARGAGGAERERALADFYGQTLPDFLQQLEKTVAPGGHVVGGHLSLADVTLYQTFTDYFDDPAKAAAAMLGCPRLLAAFDAVESHPRVKQYMAGRKQTRL